MPEKIQFNLKLTPRTRIILQELAQRNRRSVTGQIEYLILREHEWAQQTAASPRTEPGAPLTQTTPTAA